MSLTLIFYLIYTVYIYASQNSYDVSYITFDHEMTKITDIKQQIYFNQTFLFPVNGTMSPENIDVKNNTIFIFILFLSFFYKVLNKNKGKQVFFSVTYTLILFVSAMEFHFELKKSLKNCTKTDFFTVETINESTYVSQQHTMTNLYLLAISKIKYRNHFLFYRLLLLLSGDINPNPGPHDPKFGKEWETFKKGGLHFIHVNINSLIPKIDELRSIAKNTNAAVIGITESKLDETVHNSEITIENYVLIRKDRNRKGGGVACYIRDDINFTEKNIFKQDIEHILVDILLPKTKPFTVGIFYRPPNNNTFIENITEDFSKLHTENYDLFILGDMNINISKNRTNCINTTVCPLFNKYKEFLSTFGLKQLISSPTRVTCNTSSLIDHVLTNAEEKITQSGVLDIGISDHQLIFCTRKINRIKPGTTQYINFRSMKKYTQNLFMEKLRAINFLNYENFQDVNSAYSDFINKLTDVIDNIAPIK